MRFNPHAYQQTAIQYILDHPSCGLFLDMGLGKTVSTLTALKILRDDYLAVKRVLVIAPKRVALDTWPGEIEKWSHLDDVSYVMLTGAKTEREANLRKRADIYITTRDLVTWLVDYLGRDWFFDTVVIDELSSFKNNASKRFKSLRRVRPMINRVIGLTGTPKPNTYMDLWSQIYLLDQGERLGQRVTHYRRNYFNLNTFGGFPSYELQPGKDKEINRKISDICISMKGKDYLNLKDPTVIDREIRLSQKEMRLYKTLERDFLLQLDDTDITAFNSAALSNKLLQLANGAVYTDDKGHTVIHDAKIETLKELHEGEENLLVFYEFQSDKERILKAIPDAVALDGAADIKRWNEGAVKLLLAHPASAGHGMNLQNGGHVIVWFGLNWSLELYNQANARLHRQGQEEPVIIYRLIAKDTIDERVAATLAAKDKSQEALMQYLKAKIQKVRNKK